MTTLQSILPQHAEILAKLIPPIITALDLLTKSASTVAAQTGWEEIVVRGLFTRVASTLAPSGQTVRDSSSKSDLGKIV